MGIQRPRVRKYPQESVPNPRVVLGSFRTSWGSGWAGIRPICSTTSTWPVVPRPSAVCRSQQTRIAPGLVNTRYSFSNGKRWEASAARLFRVIFRYSGFGSSLASRFCGQEAARTLAVSACELVPSSSSEESPLPAFPWGTTASLLAPYRSCSLSLMSSPLTSSFQFPSARFSFFSFSFFSMMAYSFSQAVSSTSRNSSQTT